MPIFVCHCHLLHNLFDVLISCFNGPIHLRPVGRRVVMLYLELLAELSDHLVVDIGTTVRNDPLGYTISTDQIVSDKPRHDVLGYCSKGSCLNPLRKIINGYKMKRCPLDAVGLISLIMSIPHIAKGQGAIKTFRGTGGICILSA